MTQQNKQLKISILDVGHGDFIYSETPFGHRLIIDCGSGDVVPSIFLSKVSTIDELQISHPHEDHFSDIAAISKKVIRSFRCPPLGQFSDEVIGWRHLDKVKINILRKLQQTIATSNEAVSVGNGFNHIILYPNAADIDSEDPNSASFLTILQYGAFKILFGADLTTNGWEAILKNPNVVALIKGTTVYKVSHHGREIGCSPELFNLIKPALCIISDKPIDSTNENTESINWYSSQSSGCKVITKAGPSVTRRVLTTRNDGSIHLVVNPDGRWYCHSQTSWI